MSERLIGYVRVSTEEQGKVGQSLGLQQEQIQRYCELYDCDLVDILIDDGVSASIPLQNRPAGDELWDRLMAGEADGMIVTRLDRAFRITIDGLVSATQLNNRNISIHSVHERIDTSTSMGWYMLTLLLANAELERNRIRERALETTHGLRAAGRCWGAVPYGCELDENKRLRRDPNTWSVRENIVQLAERGLSLRAIAAELEERGIPAPGGGNHWHPSTLRNVLQSHSEIKTITSGESVNFSTRKRRIAV